MNKKAQVAVEFAIIISVLLVIFVSFMAIVTYRLNEASETSANIEVDNVGLLVINEIKTAREMSDGYTRKFYLPKLIEGKNYTIKILDNTELVINYSEREYVYFLPDFARGDISKGYNMIYKRDNLINVSSI